MQQHVFATPIQPAPPPPVPDETLLTSKHVRAWLGGVSDVCLWRWRVDPEVRFPPPDLTLGNRHYWQAGTVRAWLKIRQAQPGRPVASR